MLVFSSIKNREVVCAFPAMHLCRYLIDAPFSVRPVLRPVCCSGVEGHSFLSRFGCMVRGSNSGSGSREVEKRVPPSSIHEWRRSNTQVNFCSSFICSSSVEESSLYCLLEGWHAAMSGTSEEDDRCTSFGIKLK